MRIRGVEERVTLGRQKKNAPEQLLVNLRSALLEAIEKPLPIHCTLCQALATVEA